jgi:serine/threonine protein kinase
MNKGKILNGSYLIVQEIGRGGMGVLYLARHKLMPKMFAIKSLLPELAPNKDLRLRFLAELNTHCQMDHPNIVQVTDCFEEHEQLYVVMEYVAGSSFEKKIKDEGRLPEAKALSMMRQILEAIQHAHNKDIIHRDIKPSNILIGEDGRPRVTDFGIAIVNNASRLTSSPNTPIGTACYMSPEQIRTPLAIDHRSDIYALGILLYEMLTGDVPFDGETEFAIQEKQVGYHAPNPRERFTDISEPVVRIIHKAMEKKAEARYQSCAEFIKAINALIDTKPRLPIWKITAVSLGLAIPLGLTIYAMIPKERITETINVADPKQQQDAAFAIIQAASEQTVIFCTKQTELPLKKSNLVIAEKNGFFDVIDGLKNQIHDIESTITDSQAKYANFVDELTKMPTDIVDGEFTRYKNLLEQTGRANQTEKAENVHEAVQAGKANIKPSCQ